MTDLSELYQQVILDHNRSPRNFKRIESANRKAEGNNPLCGDRIQLYVQLDGETISDIGFQMPQGAGCAISKASASLMTEAVKGKPAADAEAMFQAFRDMLAGGNNAPGKLAAFSGVRAFPSRIKCANLAWHALHAALQNSGDPVTTESARDF
ncbi:MAG TPA: SUF system NifU family Fe-S cluster assembly protein [Gemmatimonadales bacterium]|jgi:nitrogen fixation NifU-like protein|nr:SUF system NifU family Fe-S cluster assembly protein [Gemmatimonadales bacterium]